MRSFSIIELVAVVSIFLIIFSTSIFLFDGVNTGFTNRSHAYVVSDIVSNLRNSAVYGIDGAINVDTVRRFRGIVFNDTAIQYYQSDETTNINDNASLLSDVFDKATNTLPDEWQRQEEIKDIDIAFCFLSTDPNDCNDTTRDVSFGEKGKWAIVFHQPDPRPIIMQELGSVIVCEDDKIEENTIVEDITCDTDKDGLKIFVGKDGNESSIIVNLFGFVYVQ